MNATPFQRFGLFALMLGLLAIAPMAIARDAANSDRERDRDRDSDKLDLPKGAKMVAEAKGEGRYKLPARGSVWLVDTDSGKAVHEGEFGEGDVYAFNAREDKVYRNGKPFEDVRLDRDRTYRIYFYETPARDKDSRNEKERRVDPKRPVPDSAELIAEGRDKELSVKADARGTAYLYDASHDELIETFNLSPGDRLTISPKSNAMSVNEKTVSRDIELSRRVTYKLFFDSK